MADGLTVLTAEIRIVIPGTPAPKGSMKCVGARGGRGHQLVDQLKRTKPWQETIAAAVRREWPHNQHAHDHQPIGCEATITVPRPAYHYGTGKNARQVKSRYADVFPVEHGHGDTDKHSRSILDALQSTDVLPDDAQVVDLTAYKRFEEPQHPTGDVLPCPGVVIRLYPL